MSQTIITHDPFPGGGQNKLGVNAAALIAAGHFTLGTIIVTTAGSAGNLVLNDVATLGAAASGNQVMSLAFGASQLAVNTPYVLKFPFMKGIVISAIPTGMVLNISWG